MPIPMGSWLIRRRRRLLPSNSSVTVPSLRPWASPSNRGSLSIHLSRKARISHPIVCSLEMSLAFVCCSATRICRFLPRPTIWPVPCRFPQLPHMRRSIRPVPRLASLRLRLQGLVLIPSLRVWERNPFPTNWSRSLISVVSRRL